MADLPPDQATLEAHLDGVRFLQGIEDGRWIVQHYQFPDLYVRVIGKDFASGQVFAHDFHFECHGFPATAPFVERWAFGDGPTFGQRPPAPTGSPGFTNALKDWGDHGTHGGIYLAWQRHAAVHNGWTQKRPDQAWHRNRPLVFIMENLHALMAEQAQHMALQQPVPA